MRVFRDSPDEIVLRIPVGTEAEGLAALFAACAEGIINRKINGQEHLRLAAAQKAERIAGLIREKNYPA